MRHIALPTLFVLIAVPCSAFDCWNDAGQRYGVSPQLLYAMAQVESGLNPLAVNRSHLRRTRSYDIGLMQINSSHLGALARFGIREADLYDACTNISVAAWLLSQQFARYGVSWEAVGAYNAACSQLKGEHCQRARSAYAWRVYRRLAGQSAPSHASRTSADMRAVFTPHPVLLSSGVAP